MDDLDVCEYSTIDISALRMDHETSHCAGVSLLDVTNISFDSFLLSGGTLIPEFIFDSIDVMQNGKTAVTSQEPVSTCNSTYSDNEMTSQDSISTCGSPFSNNQMTSQEPVSTCNSTYSDNEMTSQEYVSTCNSTYSDNQMTSQEPSRTCNSPSSTSHTTSQKNGSIYNSPSTESSENQMTKCPLYISPSKQILDLLCATEVTEQDNKSDTDLGESDCEQKYTVEKSNTDPLSSSPKAVTIKENLKYLNSAYCDSFHESLYFPVSNRNDNNRLTSTVTSSRAPQFQGYNDANKESEQDEYHVHSVSSVNSIGNIWESETTSLLNQNTNQEETSPSFSNVDTLSTTIDAQLSRQDKPPGEISSCLSMMDKRTNMSASTFSREHISLVDHQSSSSDIEIYLAEEQSVLSSQRKHPRNSPPFLSRIDVNQTWINSAQPNEDSKSSTSSIYGIPKQETTVLSCQGTNPGSSPQTLSMIDTEASRRETSLSPQEIPRVAPREETLPSSNCLDKGPVGEALQLSSSLELVPTECNLVNFTALRYIQPKSSQLLVTPDVPSTSIVFSNVVAALSPTESESSESELGIKKKGRINYSTKQLRILEKSFLENPYPNTEHIEQLASNIDLPVPRLRVWFQNKRARWRKRAKNNETSTYPVYQPPLSLAVSSQSRSEPLCIQPVSRSNVSNPSHLRTQTPSSTESEQMTSLSTNKMTPRLQHDENHVSFGNVRSKYSSHLPTSRELRAVPSIPTAVRYNSKLLTSAVFPQLNSVPAKTPLLPCKVTAAEPDVLPLLANSISSGPSAFSSVTSQKSRVFSSLENTLLPNLCRVKSPSLNIHPNVSTSTPTSGTDSYKYIMYDMTKNPMNTSSSLYESFRIPLPSVPLPSGFQPYFPLLQPAIPRYGGRHVPPYYSV